MRQQEPSVAGAGLELKRVEDDVMAGGVGPGVDLLRGSSGGCVGMDADAGEVVAEALLHILPEGGLEGFAGGGRESGHGFRRSGIEAAWRVCRGSLYLGWNRRRGEGRLRHGQHVPGEVIGLLLERVVS
jgi:hypothetical protein